MGWEQILGYLFKLLGTIIDLKQKNQLTTEKLDGMVNSLHQVPDPKRAPTQ